MDDIELRTHDSSLPLATEPDQHPLVFQAAFNSGSPELLELVYEPAGVFVSAPGTVEAGTARKRANAEFQRIGVPISVVVRHVYVAGEIALLVCDWTIDGMGANGAHVGLAGTATDVARRGADGFWRYVIDNPFGTA